MPVHPAGAVARHVRDLVERQRLDALADSDLLVRYRASRDDGAFAALVRRHGPMVLGTCRRILSRAHDAEDACQATFLVLARKAVTVRGGAALAGWLHRVAVRAASRLRRDLARWPTEPLPPDVVNPAPAVGGLEWREVRGAFDTEVGRLPDRFRLPLVLCYLQGKTRAEAAAELGWSEGAVRGRLERGRKLLQSRFVRRGITLPAALLTLLAEDAGAGVAEATPTSTAARLADALVRSMSVARAKAVGWAVAATLMLGTLVGVGMYGPVTAGQKPDSSPAAKAAPPAVADAERNLDTFTLRVSLAPAGKGKFDPKYELYSVFLYVPNLRLEPPENGPSGKPVEAHARIIREQAKKITAALKEQGFFDDPAILRVPVKQAFDRTKPHAALTVRHQNGEDATTREHVYDWGPKMLPPLDALRACVDGDAAVALDRLLGQLDPDRKNWDPRETDLKLLQGSWVTDFGRAGGVAVPPEYAKCVIDGTKIVFKPRVQTDPVLDLETIRGKFTFEPTADGKRTKGLAVAGVRDTVSKTETGEWFILYEVTDNTLILTLPGRVKGPGVGSNTRITGELVYKLRRVPEKGQSAWGEPADGIRTRVTALKTTFAVDEGIDLALDVKAEAGPRSWAAGRAEVLARIEVNGVWYAPAAEPRYYIPRHDLAAGSEVSRWVTVQLGPSWVTEEAGGKNPRRALDLKPGKYTIRLKYTFWAGIGDGVSATPVSGPLQIEVVAPPKGPPVKATGEWGDPTDGLRLRARPVNARVPADEAPVIELDLKADPGTAVWHAQRFRVQPRVEVDGVWYIPEIGTDFYQYIPTSELRAGEQIDRWVSVTLTGKLVAESRNGPPNAARLALKPGKHTVRIAYRFASGDKVVEPVSRSVEIEVLSPVGPGRAFPAPWGEPQNGVRLRARPQKTPVAADEFPVFELDAKSDTSGAIWHAPRHGPSATVEVDGLLYHFPTVELKKLASHVLKAGEQVDRWTTVTLDGEMTPVAKEVPVGWRFKMAPGKHTVRIHYTFFPELPSQNTAEPVSAPVEIEVLPSAKEPVAAWGESSEGIRLRARASSPRIAADELLVIDLDAKADAAGVPVWQAPRSSEFAQVEIDGTWYSAEIDLRKVVRRELKAGQQIDRWVSVPLSGRLISVVQPGKFAKPLDLKPGKHTVRIGYAFYPDAPGVGGAAAPVSNPVEIEILPPAAAEAGWRRAWSVKGDWVPESRQLNDFLFRNAGTSLVTATDTELRSWDVSGPPPEKATVHPFSFRGQLVGFLDQDEPAFAEVTPRTTVSGQVFEVAVRRVWSKTRGAADLKVATLDEQPRSLALSPDGTQLATMAYRWDEVRIFDVKTREERRLRAPAVATRASMILPHALIFSPDSKTLIGLGANDYPVLRRSNGAVVAWNIATGAVKWEIVETEPLRAWAFSADGQRLATAGSMTGEVQVRDADSGDLVLRYAVPGAGAVALSPDGRTLVISHRGSDGSKPSVRIRPVDGPGEVTEIQTTAFVKRIAFRPDGKALVTADLNGEIALWVRTKE